MRPSARKNRRTTLRSTHVLVAGMALTLTGTLLVTGGPSLAASADGHHGTPSKADVQRAERRVESRKRSVAAIRHDLVAAQSRVMSVSNAAEIATEKYDAAAWHLQVAAKAATKAQRKAAKAQAKVTAQRAQIGRLVVLNYTNATTLGQVSSYLRARGVTDLVDSWSTYQSVGSTMDSRYDAYLRDRAAAVKARTAAASAKAKATKLAADAKTQQRAAAAAVATAQSQASAISAQKVRLVHELARAQGISLRLAKQRQKALALAALRRRIAEEKRREAAERKRQQQQQQSGSGGSSGGGSAPTPSPTPTPPSAGGVSAAIAYARAQLGKPYVWAAAGPNSFDCSGLTMMAWRAGGKSLPHYSAGQYAVTEHISVGQLQPGDLVFWGSTPSTIHHVAMYLGGGMIIQAPHTGADVDIESMYAWEAPNFFSRV